MKHTLPQHSTSPNGRSSPKRILPTSDSSRGHTPPHTFAEQEKITITAAGAAARRSRYVLMALQAFSLLLAVMLFNTCRFNWTDERLKLAIIARDLLAAVPPPHAQIQPLGHQGGQSYDYVVVPVRNDQQREQEAAEWISAWQDQVATAAHLVGAEDVLRAADWVLLNGYSKRDVESKIDALHAFRFANLMTLRMPLVGVQIDANGLGIIAGLGVSILLLWLALSIVGERTNIERMRDADRLEVLEAIRLETLFFPHEKLHDGSSREILRKRVLRIIPRIAIVVPLLLVVGLLVNDMLTTFIGEMTNPVMTYVTLCLESACVCWIGVLTYWCLAEYRELLHAWDTVAERIAKRTLQYKCAVPRLQVEGAGMAS